MFRYHRFAPARSRQSQQGFTLIELLVVIVILGVLSAVVVFAVQGAGDRGKKAASLTDVRTLRTAEEAHCGNKGAYASTEELTGNFVSEAPTLHKVLKLTDGGPCGNTNYAVTCNPTSDVCGPDGAFPDPNFLGTASGQWKDLVVANQVEQPPFAVNRAPGGSATPLSDGRVLVVGLGPFNEAEGFYDNFPIFIFNPTSTPPWSQIGVLDGDSAYDRPTLGGLPYVGRPVALAGGGAFVKTLAGYAVLDGSTWTEIQVNRTGAIKGEGQPRFGRRAVPSYTVISGTSCGNYCGRVLIVGQGNEENFASCTECSGLGWPIAELYDPVSKHFDAIDCAYDALGNNSTIGRTPLAITLQDGRIMLFGSKNPSTHGVLFLDPSKIRIDNVDPGNCDPSTSPWTAPTALGSDSPNKYHTSPSGSAVLLSDGRVLVAGDQLPELYDPNGPSTSDGSRWTPVTGAGCDDFSNPCNILGTLPGGSALISIAAYITGSSGDPSYVFGPETYRFDGVSSSFIAMGSLQNALSAGAGVSIAGHILALGDHLAEVYSP